MIAEQPLKTELSLTQPMALYLAVRDAQMRQTLSKRQSVELPAREIRRVVVSAEEVDAVQTPLTRPPEANVKVVPVASRETVKVKLSAEEPPQAANPIERSLTAAIAPEAHDRSDKGTVLSVAMSLPTKPAEAVRQTVEPITIPMLVEAPSLDKHEQGDEHVDFEEVAAEITDEIEVFIMALQSFTTMPEVATPPDESADVLPFSLDSQDIQETGLSDADGHKAPTVVTIEAVLAKQLTELELEAKTIVAPMLKDVLETVHEIKLFEAEDADPRVIERAKAKLEKQIIVVLAYLGTEYGAADLEQFVITMLRPDFHSLQGQKMDEAHADLEHEGTHEAKLSLMHSAGILTDIGQQIRRLLGKLVLSCPQ